MKTIMPIVDPNRRQWYIVDLNGATLGVVAWILSYAVETAVSTWRLRKLGWYVQG